MKIKLSAALAAAVVLVTANANAEVEVKTDGGLRVSDDNYSFRVGARIMYDYNKSELNGVTDEDGFDVRRARVYISGTVAEDWGFKSQWNVDGDGFEDLYIRYTGFGSAARITIGNQKVPFGLEELQSSKDISVLERSAITEQYAVGRSESVQLDGKLGSNQTYAISAYTQDEAEDDAKEDVGFAARYTIAPINNDSTVVHLGAAYRDIADENAFGLEFGLATGPFHFQAEYADGDFGDVSENGYYAQAGYVITGESRPYSGGVFGRIAPGGNGGAWEAVVRYEDGYGNHSDIELGRTDASAFTVGLNYYPHKTVRIGMNYTDGDSNVANEDGSFDDGNEFRIRFQLAF
ncbi:OprO/OprP family phosphate-selective porin [Arenicella sp.]|nr:OprO/OprP family phosphate-selective porin [Arenicella sp.]